MALDTCSMVINDGWAIDNNDNDVIGGHSTEAQQQ
jgi:hypothetical protein